MNNMKRYRTNFSYEQRILVLIHYPEVVELETATLPIKLFATRHDPKPVPSVSQAHDMSEVNISPGLLRGKFTRGFEILNFYEFLLSSISFTFPAYRSLTYFTILTALG
jgi:hypothetical protein